MAKRNIETYLVTNCGTCGDRMQRKYVPVDEVGSMVSNLTKHEVKNRKLKSGATCRDYIVNNGLCDYCFEYIESDGDEDIEELLREEGFC